VNRYEKARRTIGGQRRYVEADFREALAATPRPAGPTTVAKVIHLPTRGPQLQCLVSVDDLGADGIEEHVSVSYGRGAKRVPTWDDLVLVRALAWDDDAEVHQTLPALTGPRASEWVSVPGVEVLHLRRMRPTT
tara:strand:- start:96 stop:497 length:402 start_codon:yes stop_codon:yes gene_type:complete